MSRALLIGLALAALLIPAGCENTAASPAERAAVEAAISGYLDALAAAYSSLELSGLEEWASPNEILAVRKLLTDLARTGDRIEASLLGYQVDHLEVFREINATVRLVEIWDVVRFDAFSGVEKGRTPESIQNTIIQLRLVDERWVVVGRVVTQRETPVPEPAGEPEG
jgi:hypothetical protein